ncbi:MAG: hypothetical protein CL933_09320 [Deltaproteobacteria bacterium]|nr:hypothetical protein [Deltaproteobacteria bacterium]
MDSHERRAGENATALGHLRVCELCDARGGPIADDPPTPRWRLLHIARLVLIVAFSLPAAEAPANDLPVWLSDDLRSEIFPGSAHSDAIGGDPPAALVFEGRVPVGYLFATRDVVGGLSFVSSTFSIIAGIDLKGHLAGARLVRHHQPIIDGAVQQRVTAFIARYEGIQFERTWQVEPDGALAEGEIDAISSATISSTLFNQTILRSARRVAQSRGLDGDEHPTRIRLDDPIASRAPDRPLCGAGHARPSGPQSAGRRQL